MVAEPAASTKTPEAALSKVPVCPIFFNFNNLLTSFTASADVIPDSIQINRLYNVLFIKGMNPFCIVLVAIVLLKKNENVIKNIFL